MPQNLFKRVAFSPLVSCRFGLICMDGPVAFDQASTQVYSVREFVHSKNYVSARALPPLWHSDSIWITPFLGKTVRDLSVVPHSSFWNCVQRSLFSTLCRYFLPAPSDTDCVRGHTAPMASALHIFSLATTLLTTGLDSNITLNKMAVLGLRHCLEYQ